jgi:peptidoglycan/LPS O-acetylase OafA/YrhL
VPKTLSLPSARGAPQGIATLNSIQALRGLAAAFVVLYHSGLRLGGVDGAVLAWFTTHVIQRGHVGVDVFFVISGFIIAWVAVLAPATPEAPARFAIRRLCRLAPPYWAMSAVHAALLNPVSLAVFASSLAFLPVAQSDAPYYGYPALYVGWSLNYELAFYAIFALGLWLARRHVLWVVAGLLGFTTIVLPWLRFGGIDLDPEHLQPFSSTWLSMISNPLVLEFLLGCALAWLYARTRDLLTPTVAALLFAGGTTAFAWSVVAVEPTFSLWGRGLPAAALLFGAVAAEHCGLLRIPRSLMRLGELSYALYLVHPTVIEGVKRMTPELRPEQPGWQLLRFGVNVVLSLGLAMLLHRWVERPGMAFGKQWALRVGEAQPVLARRSR